MESLDQDKLNEYIEESLKKNFIKNGIKEAIEQIMSSASYKQLKFLLCLSSNNTNITKLFTLQQKRALKLETLDKYSIFLASKYLNKEDIVNLSLSAKDLEHNAEKFHYNPVSITPEDLKLFPNLQTLYLYTDEDVETWMDYDGDKFCRIEVLVPSSDRDAIDIIETLETLATGDEERAKVVTFRNVTLTDNDVLGFIDQQTGEYKFNDGVYISGDKKEAKFVVTSIGDGAFQRCQRLTSITIPDSVKSIGKEAFERCMWLESITIPNSVESIGSNAFYRCIGLESITIPNSVESIGSSAFEGCRRLTSITIPNNVTSIGYWAFSECAGLKSIDIQNCVIGDRMFEGCTGLESVTIPNSVTSIGDWAFSKCAELTSIDIQNGVIGERMFYGCTGLESIIIPKSVTSIGEEAFYGCEGLTSIEIPNSVESIGKSAFKGCTGLDSVTIPDSVTVIGDSAFYRCDNLKHIYVYSDRVRDLVVQNRKVFWGDRVVYINPSIVEVIKK